MLFIRYFKIMETHNIFAFPFELLCFKYTRICFKLAMCTCLPGASHNFHIFIAGMCLCKIAHKHTHTHADTNKYRIHVVAHQCLRFALQCLLCLTNTLLIRSVGSKISATTCSKQAQCRKAQN